MKDLKQFPRHQARKIQILPDALESPRTFAASFSSETPVDRIFGKEILRHDDDGVDFTRVRDGKLPLLAFHDQKSWPIGTVENFALDSDGKKTRGLIRFAETPRADEPLSLLRQGVPLDLSIGYDLDFETADYDAQSDTYRFRWVPAEVSILPLGADPTVGIGRGRTCNSGVSKMTIESEMPAASGAESAPEPTPADFTAIKREYRVIKQGAERDAIAKERRRIADIHELFDLPIVPQNEFYQGVRARAIDEGWAVEATRKAMLEMLSGEAEPAIDHVSVDTTPRVTVATHAGRIAPVVMPARPLMSSRGAVTMEADALDKYRDGAQHALLVRSGILDSREERAKAREGGMVGMSLLRMAEQYLRVVNIPTVNLSDEDMAGRAFTTRASGMTTSDFTNILGTVANRALLKGWEEAPETWQIWTRRGQLPDFKATERAGLSGFSGLDEIQEDGEIKYGKFTDRKELIQLAEYAKKFRLSRRVVINDDLQAFTQIPRMMGRAANRKVGDVVYSKLDDVGPTLNQDSLALFHAATHKNYSTGANAPAVATLNTAVTAMAKQTDPNSGAALNISPRFLIVPKALEMTCAVLKAATYDPAGTAGTLTPNPFSGRFEVVSDARMDGLTNGATAWVLAGDPNVFDTIEVAFLNGVAEPYLREEQEWDTRGVEYVVGVDFGVSVLDFRALYRFKGA